MTVTRTPATLTDLVELACLAPSVHNTQPWTWRISDSVVELYADGRHQLPAADPLGHQLVLSCGAALHHAQVAAAGLGWRAEVERFPDGPDSELLARLRLTPAPTTTAATAALEALRRRRTDRRRFTSWPVPDERLGELADIAHQWGVVATAITDVVERDTLDVLLDRAFDVQAADPLLALEQLAWVEHGADDGVPSDAVPDASGTAPGHHSRFGSGTLANTDRDLEGTDGLLVLGTVDDDRAGWLRAGEALSALWLAATEAGLAVVPSSQIIEVSETRAALQREILGTLAVPHVLVRIGWPAISRAQLTPAPRRPLAEVLRPA